MQSINAGTAILNALSHHDIPDCEKDELTLCREAAAHARARLTLSMLVPGFVARLIRRRIMRNELDQAVLRLAETSPHLLKDIGIPQGLGYNVETPRGAEAAVVVVTPARKTAAQNTPAQNSPAVRPAIRVAPLAIHATGQRLALA